MSPRLLLAVVLVAGCGRSSLLGGSPSDCPPTLVLADGTCCPPSRTLPNNTCAPPPDAGHDGFHGDGGDGGHGDGGTDGFLDGGGDAGDGGDLCSDPNNCKLPECAGDPRCHVLGTEVCNNCIDDNDNGLIDCADPQCFNFPGCQGTPDCSDPNNCLNPQCACQNPMCKDLKCHPTVDFGTLQPSPVGTTSTRMENTVGTTDVTTTQCAPGKAGMVVGTFVLAGTSSSAVTLSFTQGKGEDHVFALTRAGVNQGCGDNPIACYDPKGALSGSTSFVLDPGQYYLITQPFEPAGQGPVTVTLSTAHTPEICNNGVDDNGNGLVDCQDPDCFNAPNCQNQECKPQINVGTVVVNAPGAMTSFNTSASGDTSENPTCEGTPGGGDVVVKFSIAQTAGILLQFQQSGDHVVGFYKMPPPGEKCDVQQLGCFDPSGNPSETVAWGEYPAGEYLFIFKALKPGDEGSVNATISAYENRDIEICHNGIDDNNNGLIDCADPQCYGVPGCSAPYCMPDRQLGQMTVGESQTVMLNIQQDGTTGYHVSCAKSSAAKGMVVQLTVPSGGTNGGFGLGFDCTQTGDQVIALDAAGGPRDACDVDELVCADPKTLPFGCGYEVPNLQPGTYNVIVEGFQPGSEGSMNLTLSVIDDRQLEICNNGIDDDGNGLIDCADPKCFTSPFCTTAQCRPDQTISPMPLTGQQVFKLVQTASNGVHGQVPCATATGGQSAVVEIDLTANANLNLQWNQIGNHDFALFAVQSSAAPCDAGTLIGSCVKSNGASAGSTSFTNVPQGKYYLIVQGDQPDGTTQYSGSVDVALSGTPAP